MRAAAIDIGTNTVLLTIAEGFRTAPRVLLEQATITRLGAGVDRTQRLADTAIARTLACLNDYRRALDDFSVDRTEAVCTSAARDSVNAESFLDAAEAALGVRPRVIAGQEEARLTFAGAHSGLPRTDERVGVFDIGGGSTEVIVGQWRAERPTLEFVTSFDVGSVRLTERFFRSDPPDSGEIECARALLAEQLQHLPTIGMPAKQIGVAGTLTTLKAIELELDPYDPSRVHGTTLTMATISRLLGRLCRLTSRQRSALTGLDPARADVIVAGTLIVEAVLARTGASACVVSDRGVRWGLIGELLAGTESPVNHD